MKTPTIFVAVLGLLLPSAVQADQASADACAGGLSKDGQLLYSKTAPTIKPATNIKDALTSVGRPLVMNGTLSREAARTAAEAAGECLKLLK